MFSCEFCEISKNTFLQNTSGRLSDSPEIWWLTLVKMISCNLKLLYCRYYVINILYEYAETCIQAWNHFNISKDLNKVYQKKLINNEKIINCCFSVYTS